MANDSWTKNGLRFEVAFFLLCKNFLDFKTRATVFGGAILKPAVTDSRNHHRLSLAG